MDQFDFYRLPKFIRTQILLELDFVDLIKFATCSSREKHDVHGVTTRIESVKMSLIMESNVSRYVELSSPDRRKLRWYFMSERHVEAPDALEEIEERLINGRRIDSCVYRLSSFDKMVTVKNRYESDMLKAMTFITEIFTVEMDVFQLEVRWDTDLKQLLHYPLLHKVETFKLLSCSLSNDETNCILENIRAEKFVFDGNPGPNFRFNKNFFGYDALRLNTSHWLTLGNLFQITRDCKSVEIKNPSFQDFQLNLLVRDWLERDGTGGMEYLKVIRSVERQPIELAVILDGMEWTVGVRKDTSGQTRQFNPPVPHESGADIRRHDGKLATVCVESSHFGHIFWFTIWNVENPNI